jgi:hypothetical protein
LPSRTQRRCARHDRQLLDANRVGLQRIVVDPRRRDADFGSHQATIVSPAPELPQQWLKSYPASTIRSMESFLP